MREAHGDTADLLHRLSAQDQAIVFSDRPAREMAELLSKSIDSIYTLRRNRRLADSE